MQMTAYPASDDKSMSYDCKGLCVVFPFGKRDGEPSPALHPLNPPRLVLQTVSAAESLWAVCPILPSQHPLKDHSAPLLLSQFKPLAGMQWAFADFFAAAMPVRCQ